MTDEEYGIFVIDDEIVSLGINPHFNDFITTEELEINTAKGHRFIAGDFSDEIMKTWKDGNKHYGLFKIQAIGWEIPLQIHGGLLLDFMLFE